MECTDQDDSGQYYYRNEAYLNNVRFDNQDHDYDSEYNDQEYW